MSNRTSLNRAGVVIAGRPSVKAVRALAISLALTLAMTVAAHAADAPPPMVVPGQFNVSATGAATYSIPIAVPPGTAGMVPSLSLEYSSSNGDGDEGYGWTLSFALGNLRHPGSGSKKPGLDSALTASAPRFDVNNADGSTTSEPVTSNATVGMNWALSGLPSIQRCPRTLAQDGIHGGINYNADDRFCLNGQRLVLVSGTYGASGSEYRTEIETFAKIVETGSGTGSSSYFTVRTKDGLTLEFGSTTDSRVLAVTTSVPRAWALNKVTDTKGNYFTISYINDTTNGQAYPDRIDYTGNASASLSPYASVQFYYTSRTDAPPQYQAGSQLTTTVRLTNIRTYVGTTLVSNYVLGYRAGTSTAHSRLTSVSLCDPSNVCLPDTTIGWQGGSGSLSVTASTAQDVLVAGTVPMDLNGDGLTDLFTWDPPSASHCAPGGGIYVGSQTGTFSYGGMTATAPSGTYGACFAIETIIDPSFVATNIGDFDGDGIPDIAGSLIPPGSGVASDYGTFTTDGSGHYTVATLPYLGAYPVADFNGDGRSDIFAYNPFTNLGYANFSNGTSSSTMTQDTAHSALTPGIFADFDGDGCTDNLATTGGTATPKVYYYCNPAVATATWSQSSNQVAVAHADFNGDGKTDILVATTSGGSTTFTTRISTGVGFQSYTASLSGVTLTAADVYAVGDWNGDGKYDLAVATPTALYIFLSTGTDFVLATTQSLSHYSGLIGVMDINSDGAPDIVLQDDTTGVVTQYVFDYAPEYVTSIANGIGASTAIIYDRISRNSTFYSRGTSPTYPTKIIDGPIYVVSQVDASNGIGSNYSTAYSYSGAQADQWGRGFLGFAQTSAKDLQTGIVTTTNYHTDFPYIGHVASQTIATTNTRNGCTAGVTLKTVTNSFGVTPATTSPAPYFVSLTRSDVTGADCDGTALPSTRTDYAYGSYGTASDSFGSPTQVGVTIYTGSIGSTVSSTSVTNNTYTSNCASTWLCLLTSTAVTNTINSVSVTRTTDFAYQSGTDFIDEQIVEPGSSTLLADTLYTLDAFGNRTAAQTSGSNFTTRTRSETFEPNGRFGLTATDEAGHIESFANDNRFGGLLTHVDFNTLTTSWTYDSFGRKILEARADGMQTAVSYLYCSGEFGGSYTCPTNGAFVAQATPQQTSGGTQNGPQTVSYYDTLGRGIAADAQGFSSAWIRSSTAYDASGRVYQTSRPYFLSGGTAAPSTFTYDDLGRVTLAVMPDSSRTSYTYAGLVSSVTNFLGQTTSFTKNPQGPNASVTDPLGHVTSYTYDAFGNLATVTDPSGNVIANTYDLRGDKTASSDRDMGSWSYTYDGLGELLTQTDAKSQTTTLTYDLLDRVTQRAETGLTSNWTWDTATHGVGLLASATTGAGYSRVPTYDSLSRPSTTTLTIGGTAYVYTTTYDTTNGQIATVAYPSGFAAHRVYTSLGYLSQVQDNSSSAVLFTVSTRDAELHLTGATAGNGVVTTAAFDANTGLPQNLRAGTSGTVASFDYVYDTIGNLASRADNDTSYTERFCYDALNRLTSYQLTTSTSCPLNGGSAKTVTYDSLGNITAKSDVGTYAYPASGSSSVRPHAVSSIAGTVSGVVNPNYHYDANGNLDCVYTGSFPTACSGGGAVRKLVSTSFNMADIITEGSATVAFTYDSVHQRIVQASTVGGVTTTTNYLNDPASGAMSEKAVTASAATWTDYLTVDGQIVAQRNAGAPRSVWGSFTWGAAPWTAPTEWSYFTLDPLSSVAVIADQSGAVTQRLSYDAWGKPRYPNGTDAACGTITSPATRGFTNQEQIAALCAVNLNARIYDPTIARFLVPDDVVADVYAGQGLNRYTYVNNRPLTLTDPTGHFYMPGGDLWQVVEGSGPDADKAKRTTGPHSAEGQNDDSPDGTKGTHSAPTDGSRGVVPNGTSTPGVASVPAIVPEAETAIRIVRDLADYIIEEAGTRTKWAMAGQKGELAAEEYILLHGYRILGQHVYVSTPLGMRIVDFLVSGGPKAISLGAFEVKVNGADRTPLQIMKDHYIRDHGGVVRSWSSPYFNQHVQFGTGLMYIQNSR